MIGQNYFGILFTAGFFPALCQSKFGLQRKAYIKPEKSGFLLLESSFSANILHCTAPENCVGNWTDDAAGCSVSCGGGGTKSQTFHIIRPAAYGGTNCTMADLATQNVPCNLPACDGACLCVSAFLVCTGTNA